MVKEYYFLKMVIFIKVNLKIIKDMEKEFTQKGILDGIKENGSSMLRKDMAQKLDMINLFIRGSLFMDIGIIMEFMLIPNIISILGNGDQVLCMAKLT